MSRRSAPGRGSGPGWPTPASPAFDRLYCSPYARAKETAALLGLPDAEWQLDALLRERDFGLWEGMDRGSIERTYPRASEMKERNKFLWRPECGESVPDLDLRAREVLGTFARELHQQRVLCVTHEDVMWAFRSRLEKMTIEEWLAAQDEDHHDIANCGILHYTRTLSDEPGAPVGAKFQRVRLVDPNDAERQPEWRGDRPTALQRRGAVGPGGSHPAAVGPLTARRLGGQWPPFTE